jgi:hypothetical protein
MAGELTRLGDVLMQGARDYANIKLSREAEERARARQLEDRAYQDQTEERRFQRGITAEQLSRRMERDEGLQASVIQALINNGFLQPGDIKDPQKVQEAYAAAQKSGLTKRYEELITQGLLKPEDVGDQAKVDAAMASAGQANASTKTNATAEATRLRDEGNRIQSQIQQLEQRLSEPAQQPTNAQIQARAVMLAQQAKPDGTPSDKDIQAFLPQAAEELQRSALQDKMMEAQAARQQQQLLSSQLSDVQRRQENLETRFRVAPSQMAPTPVQAPVTQQPVQRQASPEERAAAIAAAIRASNPNPPAAQSALPDPMRDPEIQAYNVQQQVAPLQRMKSDAEKRLQVAQQEINRLKSDPKAGTAGDPRRASIGLNGIAIPQMTTPEIDQGLRARALSRLYADMSTAKQQLDQADAKLAQFNQAATQGVPQAQVKTPAFNTNTSFTPPNQTPSFGSRLTLQPAQ